jgi:TRAP-type C4-dicarboxylate transport system substrate-binding protein
MNNRSWAWRIGALLAVLVFAMGVAACGDDDDDGGDSGTSTGGAAATAPANLTLGYVTTPQHPYGVAVDQYVKLVSDLSGGAMKITPRAAYPGGDVPLLQDTVAGAPEMATVSTTVFDSAGPTNAFQALQAPFLINNYAVERAALVDEDGGQSDIANDMLDQMESDMGSLVGLAIHEGGLRSPLGKEPLVSPDDWQGKKIRATESGGMAAGLKALGAEPSAIPLPDVYDALRRGTVDGMEANTGLVATQDFYEQAKNFTGNVVLWPFPTALVMNKAAWDGLDEDQQQVLTDAADQLPAFILDRLTGGTGDPFAQNLANCGVKFLQATEADVTALEEAGATAREELAASDENVSEFIDRIQEAKDGVEDTATPATTAEPEPGVACEDISPDS